MTKELQICSYREFLYKYLFKKFPEARKEDVEDAVQNTLIKGIRFVNKWQGECSLKTWLSIIAVNIYYDTFRTKQSKKECLLESSDELLLLNKSTDEDFSETLCDIDYQNKLFKELFSNFEDNVLIKTFSMHILNEMEYKDIATNLDIPLGTVKGRIFRAKKLLQEKYREIHHKYDLTV